MEPYYSYIYFHIAGFTDLNLISTKELYFNTGNSIIDFISFSYHHSVKVMHNFNNDT